MKNESRNIEKLSADYSQLTFETAPLQSLLFLFKYLSSMSQKSPQIVSDKMKKIINIIIAIPLIALCVFLLIVGIMNPADILPILAIILAIMVGVARYLLPIKMFSRKNDKIVKKYDSAFSDKR